MCLCLTSPASAARLAQSVSIGGAVRVRVVGLLALLSDSLHTPFVGLRRGISRRREPVGSNKGDQCFSSALVCEGEVTTV